MSSAAETPPVVTTWDVRPLRRKAVANIIQAIDSSDQYIRLFASIALLSALAKGEINVFEDCPEGL